MMGWNRHLEIGWCGCAWTKGGKDGKVLMDVFRIKHDATMRLIGPSQTL